FVLLLLLFFVGLLITGVDFLLLVLGFFFFGVLVLLFVLFRTRFIPAPAHPCFLLLLFIVVFGASFGGLGVGGVARIGAGSGIGKQRGDRRPQHPRQRRLQRRKRIDLQEQGQADVLDLLLVLGRGHGRSFVCVCVSAE